MFSQERLRKENGLAVILITHDLGVMSSIADRVSVFYAGRIVESGPTADLFARPRHPYTNGLLESIPRVDARPGERLTPILGSVADNIPWDGGCAFAPRCRNEIARCREQTPGFAQAPDAENGHLLRCFHPELGVSPVGAHVVPSGAIDFGETI